MEEIKGDETPEELIEQLPKEAQGDAGLIGVADKLFQSSFMNKEGSR